MTNQETVNCTKCANPFDPRDAGPFSFDKQDFLNTSRSVCPSCMKSWITETYMKCKRRGFILPGHEPGSISIDWGKLFRYRNRKIYYYQFLAVALSLGILTVSDKDCYTVPGCLIIFPRTDGVKRQLNFNKEKDALIWALHSGSSVVYLCSKIGVDEGALTHACG